jgi:hypothetical protein
MDICGEGVWYGVRGRVFVAGCSSGTACRSISWRICFILLSPFVSPSDANVWLYPVYLST